MFLEQCNQFVSKRKTILESYLGQDISEFRDGPLQGQASLFYALFYILFAKCCLLGWDMMKLTSLR